MTGFRAWRMKCPADTAAENVGDWYDARRDACLQAACVFAAAGTTLFPSLWAAAFLIVALGLSVGAFMVNGIAIEDLLSRARAYSLEAQRALEAAREELKR